MEKSDINYVEPSAVLWKERLAGHIPADWAQEIDEFETEIRLKKQGKIDDRVFAETRLRRGAYGQRYDNGHRHDGKEDRKIPYPSGELLKGHNTVWDAPGMLRIKIPYGGMTTEQMDVMADLAEEYSDSICHVTTRQDIQLHYVHIDDTPTIFRRLAAVGITTREACGNSVRNITGCPCAGVCPDEAFNVTPYADAMFRFLLGHPDVQDFGRKFKISFSGCQDNPCALARIHDLGVMAATREENGQVKRGFKVYVGGGLGAVPFQAPLFAEFVTEAELLPITQAISRVFARLGEKKNRNRARIKFLVSHLGIEEFKRLVMEERAKLAPDPRWTAFLATVAAHEEKPLIAISNPPLSPFSKGGDRNNSPFRKGGQGGFDPWVQTNTQAQRQAGYKMVTISLPLGDITSNQLRGLVDICRRYVGDNVRTTVDQNIVLRWVRDEDLPALYQELKKIDLVEPWAGTIVDVTSCPGTDTCKLGISSSRGLSGQLREHLAAKSVAMDEAIRELSIKVSGCFNSCGQHHIADIGFYGISRKVGNYLVPHFQVVLGGQLEENGGAYGLPIVGVPSKAIPAVVDRLTEVYIAQRQDGERFQDFIRRLGKVEVKKLLDAFTEVPPYDRDPSFYRDWGGVREYSKSDIGIGECAGEVVSLVDFGLKAAERELFDAQVSHEAGKFEEAGQRAFKSMVYAAQGLVKSKNPDISENPDDVAKEFKAYFVDTKLFSDPYAGDKFAHYFFKAKDIPPRQWGSEEARQRLQEAQLFIEAAHTCNAQMSMVSAAPAV